MTNQERRIEIGEHDHNARENKREMNKGRGGGRRREKDREALLSHHITRVYGVRGKEGQQTRRAGSDGGTEGSRGGGGLWQ